MTLNYTELDAGKIEYISVAEENGLPTGERLFLEIDDFNIVVFNVAGKFFAIGDVCSHDNGPVGDGKFASDYEIACPRHGARFDVRSGKALTLPAIVDIPAYPVRVRDGQIEVGIPNED